MVKTLYSILHRSLDLTIYSEYFFRDLLNIVYGYSLENHNKKQKNAPAFDLIDNTNKIIIQVTATCKKQKIEDTLKKRVFNK